MASSPPSRNADSRAARRRMRGVVMALFALPTCAFIVSSTWQLGAAVYASPTPWMGSGALSTDETACRAGITKLAESVARARSSSIRAIHAKGAPADENLENTFVRALSPEWDDKTIFEACSKSDRGKDALSAVMRLRAADETLAHRDSAELTTVWKDVQGYVL